MKRQKVGEWKNTIPQIKIQNSFILPIKKELKKMYITNTCKQGYIVLHHHLLSPETFNLYRIRYGDITLEWAANMIRHRENRLKSRNIHQSVYTVSQKYRPYRKHTRQDIVVVRKKPHPIHTLARTKKRS